MELNGVVLPKFQSELLVRDLSSSSTRSSSCLLELLGEVGVFGQNLRGKVIDFADEVFKARADVLLQVAGYSGALGHWLNTTTDTTVTVNFSGDEYKEMLTFMEQNKVEVSGIFSGGEWSDDVDATKLTYDQVNDIKTAFEDYASTVAQSPSVDSLRLQCYAQAVNQCWILQNQVQVMLHDLQKIILQAMH